MATAIAPDGKAYSSDTALLTFDMSQNEACIVVLFRVFKKIAPVLGDFLKKALCRVYGEDKWLREASSALTKRMARFLEQDENVLKQDLFVITEVIINKAETVVWQCADVDHLRYFGVRLERLVLDVDSLNLTRNCIFHNYNLPGHDVYRCLLRAKRLCRQLTLDKECAYETTTLKNVGFEEEMQVVRQILHKGGANRTEDVIKRPLSVLQSLHRPLTIHISGLDCGNVLLLRTLFHLEALLTDFFQDKFWKETDARGQESLAQSKRRGFGIMLDMLLNPKKWKNVLNIIQATRELKPSITTVKKLRNAFAHGQMLSLSDVCDFVMAAEKIASTLSSSSASHFTEVFFNLLIDCQKVAPSAKTEVRLSERESCKVEVRLQSMVKTEAKKTENQLRPMNSVPQFLVGRDELLKNLSLIFTSYLDQSNGSPPRVLLHGPPGVGKTALARKLAAQLHENYPKQHSFQASTAETLLADIEIFLRSELQMGKGREAFRTFLISSKETFLLIFEDVRCPEKVMSLLPSDKHCALFTSVSENLWAENGQGVQESVVLSVPVPCLNTNESLELVERVLLENDRNSLFSAICKDELHKDELRSFLEHEMQNLPLAVRFLAFQLAACHSVRKAIRQILTPAYSFQSKNRFLDQAEAAGRVHTRGFSHVVSFALEILKEKNALAPPFCFAMAVLPPHGVSLWLLHLLGYHFGLKREETDGVLRLLEETGLAGREGNSSLGMHRLVQMHVRIQTEDISLRQAVLENLCEMVHSKTIKNDDRTSNSLPEILDGLAYTRWRNDAGYRTYLEMARDKLVGLQIEAVIRALIEYADNGEMRCDLVLLCYRCLKWCCVERESEAECTETFWLNRKIEGMAVENEMSLGSANRQEYVFLLNAVCAVENAVRSAKSKFRTGRLSPEIVRNQILLGGQVRACAENICEVFRKTSSEAEGGLLLRLAGSLLNKDFIEEAQVVLGSLLNVWQINEHTITLRCAKELFCKAMNFFSTVLHDNLPPKTDYEELFLEKVLLWGEVALMFLPKKPWTCYSTTRLLGICGGVFRCCHRVKDIGMTSFQSWFLWLRRLVFALRYAESVNDFPGFSILKALDCFISAVEFLKRCGHGDSPLTSWLQIKTSIYFSIARKTGIDSFFEKAPVQREFLSTIRVTIALFSGCDAIVERQVKVGEQARRNIIYAISWMASRALPDYNVSTEDFCFEVHGYWKWYFQRTVQSLNFIYEAAQQVIQNVLESGCVKIAMNDGKDDVYDTKADICLNKSQSTLVEVILTTAAICRRNGNERQAVCLEEFVSRALGTTINVRQTDDHAGEG